MPCLAATLADVDALLRRLAVAPGARPPPGAAAELTRRAAAARAAAATLRTTAGGSVPYAASSSSAPPPPQAPSAAQRAALLSGTQRLASSTAALHDASRTAHAAEAAGADILSALAAQRQQISRIQAANTDVADDVAQSGTILNRMTRWWRVGL